MQSSLTPNLAPTAHVGGPTDPSHDELLRRGIIRTDIARGVAWLLTGAFVLAIAAVPLSQVYLEHREGDDSPLLDLFRRKPTVENLRQFEKDIEQASYAKSYTQPRLQLLLDRYGRVGNKLAIDGKDGWLYYGPGVRHVGGPGFLQTDVQRSREKDALDSGESAIHADPRPAILAFNAALAKRGIRLVLMPMPDKAALEASHLTVGAAPATRPENSDFPRFLRELRAQGVAVFDAREGLPEQPAAPLYLAQDTHWTPTWMEHVSKDLARFVSRLAPLPELAAPPVQHLAEQPMSRVGDIVDMLKLPEGQTVFQPQSVLVHQVQDAEGNPWQSDPNADVLLLGDSFSNIFSLEGMGWGESAGLGPQLSFALSRPVDVIAQNDSGAHATRRALAKELAAGSDRLAGKRVVIWEFAERELSVGDWRLIDWDAPGKTEAE